MAAVKVTLSIHKKKTKKNNLNLRPKRRSEKEREGGVLYEGLPDKILHGEYYAYVAHNSD